MKKIPLAKPFFDHQEIKLLSACLKSGWVTQGPIVQEFEKRFAQLHQTKYALATTSCTSALHLAALAVGLKSGDEAIVPAYTWVTSANCIEYTGAKAVFVDIDLSTYNIDPSKIEAAITPRTKAIIVVHLFGLSADMASIMRIAQKYNLFIIEDAACAVGSHYDGKPIGGIGDIGCFSFHPRKIITTGEGGMITTNNHAFASLISSLRNHGTVGSEPGPGAMPHPYDMSRVINLGFNLRLSDIQGAVGLAQLAKLNRLLTMRRLYADKYTAAFKEIDEVITPYIPPKSEHTFQSYVVRIKRGGKERRNKIMDYLAKQGIWTRPGTHAVPHLEYYRDKHSFRPKKFINALKGEDETISLPLYHTMHNKTVVHVVNTLVKALIQIK